jgi:hypothetical protein
VKATLDSGSAARPVVVEHASVVVEVDLETFDVAAREVVDEGIWRGVGAPGGLRVPEVGVAVGA